ncbi:hypothetical protein BC628DRAFT_1356503 [Trametes gibbosa]|nr:hypothetical protein BC628DRAFT_1356503 [Trametes gibbosa]
MSHEHRALGFRPPPGSLAAEAQSAAAARSRSRRADGDGDVGGARVDDETLRAVALRDAERIMAGREMMTMTTMTMSGLGGGGGEGDDVGVGGALFLFLLS